MFTDYRADAMVDAMARARRADRAAWRRLMEHCSPRIFPDALARHYLRWFDYLRRARGALLTGVLRQLARPRHHQSAATIADSWFTPTAPAKVIRPGGWGVVLLHLHGKPTRGSHHTAGRGRAFRARPPAPAVWLFCAQRQPVSRQDDERRLATTQTRTSGNSSIARSRGTRCASSGCADTRATRSTRRPTRWRARRRGALRKGRAPRRSGVAGASPRVPRQRRPQGRREGRVARRDARRRAPRVPPRKHQVERQARLRPRLPLHLPRVSAGRGRPCARLLTLPPRTARLRRAPTPAPLGRRPLGRRHAGAARIAAFGRAPRRLARQRVGLLVERVARVTAHPLEAHVVPRDLAIELLPQVLVLRAPPAVVHRPDQILAVAAHDHRHAGIEGAQRLDRGA